MANSEWRLSHRSLLHWSLFIAILLLAAGLRPTRLGLAEFKLDEALAYYICHPDKVEKQMGVSAILWQLALP